MAPMNENSQLNQSSKIESLRRKISVLNSICNTLNPYEPISAPMQNQLEQFDIDELDNPFTVTNKLIVLLEDSVDNLNQLIDEQQKIQ